MPHIDFPSFPAVSDEYVANGITYVWNGYGWAIKGDDVGGGAIGIGAIAVGDTPPSSPELNTLWYESDTGMLFLRYDDGDSHQWIQINPQPAIPTPVQQIVQAHGCCKLRKEGTALILRRHNGNTITINGVMQTIPAAGVSLTPAGLTDGVYFVYAYMNAAVMTLEFSATGHSQDPTTGIEIKTGDTTRTLVGMAGVYSNVLYDSLTQRLVRSWFNDTGVTAWGYNAAIFNSTSTGYVAVTGLFAQTLMWAGEDMVAAVTGQCNNTTAGQVEYHSIAINGSAQIGSCIIHTPAANYWSAFALTLPNTWGGADGLVAAQLNVAVSGGSGSWYTGCVQSLSTKGRP